MDRKNEETGPIIYLYASNQSNLFEGCLAITASSLLKAVFIFSKMSTSTSTLQEGSLVLLVTGFNLCKTGNNLKDGPFPSISGLSFWTSHDNSHEPTQTYCLLVMHIIFLSKTLCHILSLLRIQTLSDV